tara:strand:- start:1512 stop:4091 length:2580 start_codon:yes stop_codon:yes gene_type:complete
MAKKQTLKSLLGGNDSRVEVDLNLDQQVFQAPTVRAGNYSVAGPVYAKTNSLIELSNSLERYSGPILKNFANIRSAQAEAMADATELLTTDQLKMLADGDASGVQESINDTENNLDVAQRKKLIKFTENPNNYKRAYQRVGSRVAGVLTEDYLTNMDKYAEDENFNFDNHVNKYAEEYGLEGLGEVEFRKQINSINETTKARFNTLKEGHAYSTAKSEIITTGVQKMSNQTFNQEDLTESLAGLTLEQQQEVVLGLITQAVDKSPAQAERLKVSIENGDFTLGNGGVDLEFVSEIENAIGNEQNRIDQLEEVAQKQYTESVDDFRNTYANAVAFNEEIPAQGEIKISETFTLTVDTSEAKTLADVSVSVRDALNNIEEGSGVTQNQKEEIASKFAKAVAEEPYTVITQRNNAGVTTASSSLMKLYDQQNSDGKNIYGLEDTAARTAKVSEDINEMNTIVADIYKDNSLSVLEKNEKASEAIRTYAAEKSKVHDEFKLDQETAIKEIKFEKATGDDQEETYFRQLNILKFGDDSVGAASASKETRVEAREFDAETDRLRNEILNRDFTADELAAGMNSEDLYLKKVEEAERLNEDRKDILMEDVAYNEKLDGKTSDQQDPTKVIKDQTKQVDPDENVVVSFSETAGLALKQTERAARGVNKSSQARRRTENYIQDITETNANVFNVGVFDAYRIAQGKRGYKNANTLHEINQAQAISFQNGQDVVGNPMEKNFMSKKEVFERHASEFLHGETVIQAYDNNAGITLDQLEKGQIKGVNFNPRKISQGTHPILPFALVNQAFKNDADLTVEQETHIRNYADALYDTSQLNDADKEIVYNKMIELQMNAYSLIGFEFSKTQDK